MVRCEIVWLTILTTLLIINIGILWRFEYVHKYISSSFETPIETKTESSAEPDPTCAEPSLNDTQFKKIYLKRYKNKKSREFLTQFVRPAPDCKYLYPKKFFRTSPAEATEICRDLGLETARITNTMDVIHLGIIPNLVGNGAIMDINLNVAGDFNELRDFYRSPFSKQDMPCLFPDEPENAPAKNCIALHRSSEGITVVQKFCDDKDVYGPLPENHGVVPLCQYRFGSDCYLKSRHYQQSIAAEPTSSSQEASTEEIVSRHQKRGKKRSADEAKKSFEPMEQILLL